MRLAVEILGAEDLQDVVDGGVVEEDAAQDAALRVEVLRRQPSVRDGGERADGFEGSASAHGTALALRCDIDGAASSRRIFFHRRRRQPVNSSAGKEASQLRTLARSPQARARGTSQPHSVIILAMPDDDDKPKRTRSWREIDKMRDKSGSSRRSDREAERFQTSTKYTQYKTNLDRLFSQGVASSALPEHLREKLGVEDDSAEAEERKKLYAIEDPKAFYAAMTAWLKSH